MAVFLLFIILIIILFLLYLFIGNESSAGIGFCLFSLSIIGLVGYEYLADKFYFREKKRPKEVVTSNEKAILIYNKCLKNGITDFNIKDNQDKLKVIADSYNLYDINQVLEFFNEGKQILKERQEEAEYKEMMYYREKELKNYKYDKKISHITGKTKYSVTMVLDEVFRFEEIIYPKVLDSITANRLIDLESVSEKMKLIEIKDIKLKKTKGLNIKVNVKIKVRKNIKILNSKAILDGSFKATIYNKNNKKIGEGYFSAPGFGRCSFDPNADIYLDSHLIYTNEPNYKYDAQWRWHYRYYSERLRYVGFNHLTSMNFLCYINDINKLQDDISTYTCKIEPVSLWIIEKLKKEPNAVSFEKRWY